MTLITMIGRGHSGTRAMSHTLSASGVFMGESAERIWVIYSLRSDMYACTRVLARYVQMAGRSTMGLGCYIRARYPIREFSGLIYSYLIFGCQSTSEHKGWKIPETTLVFPWIIRMFPEIKYIFWIRNPRDCIIGRHMTDDLTEWDIPYPDPG